MSQFILNLIGAVIGGIVVGIIVLFIQYRTDWFARSPISSSKKQALSKSSSKRLPSKKHDLTKDSGRPYTSISSFLQMKWWTGIVGLVTTIALIIAIVQFILPGDFGNRIVSPPSSDIKENSQPTIQLSDNLSSDFKEHPTPTEIYNEIQVQPLLQQKNTGDSFIGLKVQCILNYFKYLQVILILICMRLS